MYENPVRVENDNGMRRRPVSADGRCEMCLTRDGVQEARMREVLREAEEAMRFVYSACATFPHEPLHIQNAAWRKLLDALSKARVVLEEIDNKKAGVADGGPSE